MNQASVNLRIAEGTTPTNTWTDGAPLRIPSAVVLGDVRTYRRLTCAACGKRGMKATPQHTAIGGYRVLCSCRTCRHVEVC